MSLGVHSKMCLYVCTVLSLYMLYAGDKSKCPLWGSMCLFIHIVIQTLYQQQHIMDVPMYGCSTIRPGISSQAHYIMTQSLLLFENLPKSLA
jgi:tryptophan-rich sensory protein